MVGAVGFDDFDEFSYNTLQQLEFASSVDCKTRAVFSEKIKPMKASGGVDTDVKGKVTMEWGGKDGVKISGSLSGEVQKNGGYAKLEAEQKSDGTGNVSVSGGHKSDSDR